MDQLGVVNQTSFKKQEFTDVKLQPKEIDPSQNFSKDQIEYGAVKGQLILNCPFGVFNYFKKLMKKFNILYYDTSSRIVFVPFLEELKTPKGHFEIN